MTAKKAAALAIAIAIPAAWFMYDPGLFKALLISAVLGVSFFAVVISVGYLVTGGDE